MSEPSKRRSDDRRGDGGGNPSSKDPAGRGGTGNPKGSRSDAGDPGAGRSAGSGRSSRGRPGSGDDRQSSRSDHEHRGDRRGRGSDAGARPAPPKRRRDLTGAAANLPNWVVEDLARVTPPARVAGALEALAEASDALADGAYRRALRHAQRAKELAPRDATVRETLGIAAYRSGDWRTALSELRAYRRLSGETTHLPVEMDALRAMGRYRDVDAAWETLQTLGGKPAVLKEGTVVYASHLADHGELDRAWAMVDPGSMTRRPFEEDLRVWYVAARVAALRGDVARAGSIRSAILTNDPAFPGIDELERLIAKG